MLEMTIKKWKNIYTQNYKNKKNLHNVLTRLNAKKQAQNDENDFPRPFKKIWATRPHPSSLQLPLYVDKSKIAKLKKAHGYKKT